MRVVNGFWKCGLAAMTLACASGCVSVLPEANPAAPRFGVSDVDGESVTNGASVSWSLTIEDPLATRGVDTVKIARVEAGERYEYYAGGEWVDRAPRLFQTALVRSFENSERILGVGGAASQPVADYVLKADIRAFEVEETSKGMVATADVYVRLMNIRGRNYAAKRFVRRLDVSRDTATGAAKALNRAASEMIPEIIDWTLAEGERAAAEKAAR